MIGTKIGMIDFTSLWDCDLTKIGMSVLNNNMVDVNVNKEGLLEMITDSMAGV